MHRSFISMAWTPEVDAADARLLIHTIEELYELLRPRLGRPGQFDPLPTVRIFGAWSIPGAPDLQAYTSIEWYISHSMDDAGQSILASRYLQTVNLEPWQASHPHFDLCLTNLAVQDDLAGLRSNLPTLGFNRRGLVSLISTRRFDELRNLPLRRMALQHVFTHYLGLLFDIPAYSRAADVTPYHTGLYCANDCVMRPVESPQAALELAQTQAAQGTTFCEPCLTDLVAQITGYHYSLN
jgi:hypothetical protein